MSNDDEFSIIPQSMREIIILIRTTATQCVTTSIRNDWTEIMSIHKKQNKLYFDKHSIHLAFSFVICWMYVKNCQHDPQIQPTVEHISLSMNNVDVT